MMKKSFAFILGIAVGVFISFLILFLFDGKTYATLDRDFVLSNGSLLKKGTKIKHKSHFPEGFDQYVLYLHDMEISSHELELKEEKETVIPYWIESMKSDEQKPSECDSVYEIGEKMPTFLGGEIKLMEYNMEHIIPIISRAAKYNSQLVSSLRYKLIISSDGQVLSSKVPNTIDEPLKSKLEAELLTMPDWKPGQVDGHAECILVKIPISCLYWE